MPVRTAMATVCISGTLEDKLDAAAAAGFDGVEIFEPDLVASSWSPGQVRRRCAGRGLSVGLYPPVPPSWRPTCGGRGTSST